MSAIEGSMTTATLFRAYQADQMARLNREIDKALLMGKNDYHVDDDGVFRPGLVSKRELRGVIGELNDAHMAAELAAQLAARAQTLKDRKLPMLKGTGFIVIDPTAPRFDGEEMADVEDAKSHANNVAYKSGVAIIYAPIAVLRPKREVSETVPSKLLQQLGMAQASLPGAPVSTVDAPKQG